VWSYDFDGFVRSGGGLFLDLRGKRPFLGIFADSLFLSPIDTRFSVLALSGVLVLDFFFECYLLSENRKGRFFPLVRLSNILFL